MIERWLTVAKIAIITNKHKTTIARNAKEGNWPYRMVNGNGGPQKRFHIKDLPEDIRVAYAASLGMPLEALQNELKPPSEVPVKVNISGYKGRSKEEKPVKSFDQCTETEREIAFNRQKIIDQYSNADISVKQFVEFYKDNLILPKIKERLGRWGNIGSAAMFYQNWLRRYQQCGLAGLVPQYHDRGGIGVGLSQETKDRIEWLYLDPHKPSVKVVCELLGQYGIQAGEATVYRYIRSLPQSLKDKWRKGEKYFKDHYEKYIPRDYSQYKPMDMIVGDYMTQDFLLRVKEKVCRAKLVAFMDMRTRAVVGWNLQLTANSVGVVKALQMCFNQYGLPKTVYFDNGREFKNYWICGNEWKLRHTKIEPESLEQDAGLLNEVGVSVSFAEVGRGQSKPIERLWRILHERSDKFEITYTGSNSSDKPEETELYHRNVEGMKKKDITEIPTFEEIEQRLVNFFSWYNNCWDHTGDSMDGKTPVQVWKENEVAKREIPESIKKYLFTLRPVRVIQRNGIRIDGVEYYCKEMMEYIGKKVEVRMGLDQDTQVHIFSLPERKFLFDAELNIWSGNVAKDNEKVKRERKEARAILKKYNQKKAEYDQGPFQTPAEQYAMENNVVNGESLSIEEKPELKLVKPVKKYSLFK